MMVVVAFGLVACSTDDLKRSTYEGLYQKGCIDRTGAPDCDASHPDFDQYKRDRAETRKQ